MKTLSELQALYIVVVLLSITFFSQGGIQNVNAAMSPSSSQSTTNTASDRRDNANSYFEKAKKEQGKKDYSAAIKNYRKALKVDNKYAEAYSNLGYCYRKVQKYDDAITSYKKAIDVNPKLAAAHEYIGEAYAELGKFELAEKHLEILKKLDAVDAAELEAFIVKTRSN